MTKDNTPLTPDSTDVEFLRWIYNHLGNTFNETPQFSYMQRLKQFAERLSVWMDNGNVKDFVMRVGNDYAALEKERDALRSDLNTTHECYRVTIERIEREKVELQTQLNEADELRKAECNKRDHEIAHLLTNRTHLELKVKDTADLRRKLVRRYRQIVELKKHNKQLIEERNGDVTEFEKKINDMTEQLNEKRRMVYNLAVDKAQLESKLNKPVIDPEASKLRKENAELRSRLERERKQQIEYVEALDKSHKMLMASRDEALATVDRLQEKSQPTAVKDLIDKISELEGCNNRQYEMIVNRDRAFTHVSDENRKLKEQVKSLTDSNTERVEEAKRMDALSDGLRDEIKKLQGVIDSHANTIALLNRDKNHLSDENERLRGQTGNQGLSIGQLRAENENLQAAVDGKNIAVKHLTTQRDELQEEYANLQAHVKSSDKDIEDLESQVKELTQNLNNYILQVANLTEKLDAADKLVGY